MADKTCFIIMPITTPEPYLEKYRDGVEHFKHVLQCLFIPSVEKAGYEAIAPIAKGSDLIHAEIINNLEQSDLVLCDMSCLNPNVFFEFGIRTSLNKPVCVVKDEHTKRVPFDTGILNHLEYRSTIETWEIEKEIEKLAEHIRTSHERSKGENSLWKYFGLKSEARAYESETGTDAKLDYLTMQMESLRQQVGALDRKDTSIGDEISSKFIVNNVTDMIRESLPTSVFLEDITATPDGWILITYRGHWDQEDKDLITRHVMRIYRLPMRFNRILDPDEASKEKENQ